MRILYFILFFITCFLLFSCDSLRNVETSEFRIEIFNNTVDLMGFNDEYYTENLVIEDQVTYYCDEHEKNETIYVHRVYSKAFQNQNLKSVTFTVTEKSELTSILDYAFADNKDLKEVNLPPTIGFIDDYAFSNNSSIEIMNLYNVERMGDKVFLNCISLQSVKLGSNIKIMGDNVFENCKDGIVVSIDNPVPPKIGNELFKGVDNFKIIVPEELIETYKNNEDWSNYSDYIFSE